MKIQRSAGDNGMMSKTKGGNAVYGPLLEYRTYARCFCRYCLVKKGR